MIQDYLRPKNVEEAIALLSSPDAMAIYGYASQNQQINATKVVDLQLCGLNKVSSDADQLVMGSCASLEEIANHAATPGALKTAILLQERLNLRNMTSIFDAIQNCDGRSSIVTVLLALDAKLQVAGKTELVPLGDHLAIATPGLVLSVTIPTQVKVSFEFVSRTPQDTPIVCVAGTKWQSSRVRLVVGGFGPKPLLVCDGAGSDGIELAAKSAYTTATDEKASGAYRSEMAKVLALRCIEKIK